MSVPSFEIPAYDFHPDTMAAQPKGGGATRTVFLGRIAPPTPRFRLTLGDFLNLGEAVPAPESVDYATKALPSIRQILNNDREGCCVIASSMHGAGIWSSNDNAPLISSSDAEASHEYHRICGPGDNGCNIQTVLEEFQRNGILMNGVKRRIDGYCAMDFANKEQVKVAVLVFGGARLGFNVPRSWIDNAREGAVWDVPPPGSINSVGGHDVRLIDYNASGVRVATWGLIITITWRALADRRISEEAWVELSPDWYNSDKIGGSGINVTALKAALAKIAAGGLPPWQPGPSPEPTPTPPPEPTPPPNPFPHCPTICQAALIGLKGFNRVRHQFKNGDNMAMTTAELDAAKAAGGACANLDWSKIIANILAGACPAPPAATPGTCQALVSQIVGMFCKP